MAASWRLVFVLAALAVASACGKATKQDASSPASSRVPQVLPPSGTTVVLQAELLFFTRIVKAVAENDAAHIQSVSASDTTYAYGWDPGVGGDSNTNRSPQPLPLKELALHFGDRDYPFECLSPDDLTIQAFGRRGCKEIKARYQVVGREGFHVVIKAEFSENRGEYILRSLEVSHCCTLMM